MRKTFVVAAAALTLAALSAAPVWAQSSGNFAAEISTIACDVDDVDGTLTGGSCFAGPVTQDDPTANCVKVLDTTIKTPNSGQTALLIGGSLGTGIYTKTKSTGKDTTSSTSTAHGVIIVNVDICQDTNGDGVIDPPGGGDTCSSVAPDTGSGVVFDERFQQLTVKLDSLIDSCEADPATCEPESVELLLSTLSMHHSNFVTPAGVGGGLHRVIMTVTGAASASADADNSAVAAVCAGPGVLSVQQVKAFSQSGGIDIAP